MIYILFIVAILSEFFISYIIDIHYTDKSILNAIISVLIIGYYFKKKYKTFKFSFEQPFVLGILVQFILAAAIINYLTYSTGIMAYHLDTEDITHIEIFWSFIFICSFLFGYNIYTSKYTLRLTFSDSRLTTIMLLLYILIVVLRFYLLSHGTYYHVDRSDYQFKEVALVSLINKIVMLRFFVYFYFLLMIKKHYIYFFTIMTLDFIWYLPSAQREVTLAQIIIIFIGYIIYKQKVSKIALAIVAMITFFYLQIANIYKHEIFHNVDPTSISYTSFAKSSLDAVESFVEESKEGENYKQLVSYDTYMTFARLYDGVGFAWFIKYYDLNEHDLEYGITYLSILTIPIPRIIFPEKPIYTMPLNNYFPEYISQGSSMPTTLIGEAYVNFYYFGIPIIGILFGLILRLYEKFLLRMSQKHILWTILYFVIFFSLLRLGVQPMVIIISTFTSLSVIIYILVKISRRYKI